MMYDNKELLERIEKDREKDREFDPRFYGICVDPFKKYVAIEVEDEDGQ